MKYLEVFNLLLGAAALLSIVVTATTTSRHQEHHLMPVWLTMCIFTSFLLSLLLLTGVKS